MVSEVFWKRGTEWLGWGGRGFCCLIPGGYVRLLNFGSN